MPCQAGACGGCRGRGWRLEGALPSQTLPPGSSLPGRLMCVMIWWENTHRVGRRGVRHGSCVKRAPFGFAQEPLFPQLLPNGAWHTKPRYVLAFAPVAGRYWFSRGLFDDSLPACSSGAERQGDRVGRKDGAEDCNQSSVCGGRLSVRSSLRPVRRSQNRTTNSALAMEYSESCIVHSFSVLFETRSGSFEAAS